MIDENDPRVERVARALAKQMGLDPEVCVEAQDRNDIMTPAWRSLLDEAARFLAAFDAAAEK